MRIGFIGMDMPGLPMALAVATRGHQVRGFDAGPQRGNLECDPTPDAVADCLSLAIRRLVSVAADSWCRVRACDRVRLVAVGRATTAR